MQLAAINKLFFRPFSFAPPGFPGFANYVYWGDYFITSDYQSSTTLQYVYIIPGITMRVVGLMPTSSILQVFSIEWKWGTVLVL